MATVQEMARPCYDHRQMAAPRSSEPRLRWIVAKTIALCVLIAGTLDISDALVFYGVRGTPPRLLLQVIVSGLLGQAALRGGLPTALLGLAIHFAITSCWATAFVLASLRFRGLRRHPCIVGPAYGLLIYGVMNGLVLPHSREVGHRSFQLAIICNGVGALMLCMGLPIALISRRMLPDE
jgi:hypothetical protein